MKKPVLIILAVVILGLCGVCAIGGKFAFDAYGKAQGDIDKELQPSVEKVVTTWDAEAFRQVASEAAIKAQPKEVLEAWFKKFRDEYGVAKSVPAGRMTGFKTNWDNGKEVTTATVLYDVDFEKKRGTVQVIAVKVGEGWKIQKLDLNLSD